MADREPNQPEDQTPDGDAGEQEMVSQEDIDAALAAAGGGEPTEAEAPVDAEPSHEVEAAEPNEFDQPVEAETIGQANDVSHAAVQIDMPDFTGTDSTMDANELAMLGDVRLDVKIELGRSDMYIEDVLKLGKGSVVELDRLAGDPVDVLVNERLVARGEVLVLNDNFCVRISEILVGKDL